jgi:hypothetical protein
MKRQFLLLLFLLGVTYGCQFLPGGDRSNAGKDKILQIRVIPLAGSDYDYKVSNQTAIKFDVNDKTFENNNSTDYTVNYKINKDSVGNYIIGIKYKKIHIDNNQNDVESELDADNAANTSNPVEKMLGALKDTKITATVSPGGNVIGVTGYQQIANQFLSQIDGMDPNAKIAAQRQWQQLIEKSIVKKNLQKLFNIFPDSSIHIGDRWKMEYKEEGDINFLVKDFFTLKTVEDGKAIVESAGHISTDSAASSIMGYQLNPNLKGEQKGEYEIDLKSGMMKSCNVSSQIEGTLEVIGREIPITVDIKIKMEGSEN